MTEDDRPPDYTVPINKDSDEELASISRQYPGGPVIFHDRPITALSKEEQQVIVHAAFKLYQRFSKQTGLKAVGDVVVMPRSLTAENGAKGLLLGEFSETISLLDAGHICEECLDDCSCEDAKYVKQEVPVEWTTIKRIYDLCVKHLGS